MKKTLLFLSAFSGLCANQIKMEEIKEVEKIEQNSFKSIGKKMFSDLKLNGFGFARYFGNFGRDGEGMSQQYRIKLDITTAAVYGYSVTGGLFFSQGTSTPDVGNVTHGSVQGSRGVAYNDNFSDRFGIGVFYASKQMDFERLQLKFDIGRMNLQSPLNDKNLDMASGVHISLKYQGVEYFFSYSNSWMSDNFAYVIRQSNPKANASDTTTLSNQQAAAIGIGNDLFLLGASGKNIFGGLDFNVTFGNAVNFIDYMLFLDGQYKIKKDYGDFGVCAQIATAGLNATPNLLLGGNRGKSIYSDLKNTLKDQAKNRGIYNISLFYKISGYGIKAGFLKSFGDGYGVLMTSKGGLDVVGKMWLSNFTATYEGFGFLSSGSKKDSDIQVIYATTDYSFKFPLKIALDVAYITGKNNFVLTNAVQNSKNTKDKFRDLSFVELTPSIKYSFTKQLDLSMASSFYFGDLNKIRVMAELKYSF
ncbi:hypothetical protein LW135_02755 [Helicobacter sp. faydin-H20]|uniref:hypothetical protein n=1 Tax=Helicobacter anatolicus TaxID=2905874 RepID=UPI001E307325|nr:hypothetical protein [Helicobacter anatolicus]MCE3036750.1 hypothetical protein [Helicobacter anatolicus]